MAEMFVPLSDGVSSLMGLGSGVMVKDAASVDGAGMTTPAASLLLSTGDRGGVMDMACEVSAEVEGSAVPGFLTRGPLSLTVL